MRSCSDRTYQGDIFAFYGGATPSSSSSSASPLPVFVCLYEMDPHCSSPATRLDNRAVVWKDSVIMYGGNSNDHTQVGHSSCLLRSALRGVWCFPPHVPDWLFALKFIGYYCGVLFAYVSAATVCNRATKYQTWKHAFEEPSLGGMLFGVMLPLCPLALAINLLSFLSLLMVDALYWSRVLPSRGVVAELSMATTAPDQSSIVRARSRSLPLSQWHYTWAP